MIHDSRNMQIAISVMSTTSSTAALLLQPYVGSFWAVGITATVSSLAWWFGGKTSDITVRRRSDAQSLMDHRCPNCGSPLLELTSDNDIACVSCRMVYHPHGNGTVTRVGYEKTNEVQGG